MKIVSLSDFSRAALVLSLGAGMGLTSCISLESPSGRGPDWAANLKARSEAKKAAKAAQNGTAVPGAAPASNGGYVTTADGTVVPVPAAPASSSSSGGYKFFGTVNPGGAPDMPKRPSYEQSGRRPIIRESEEANKQALRQDLSAPQQAVIYDKKTGYPVNQSTATGYEDNALPLPRHGGGESSGGFAEAPRTPASAPPLTMDPKDIMTGTRGSNYGRVRSPYPPYLELDSAGLLPGALARDPATGKVFRVP
ncbi:MAG: hypothetical protein ACAI34_25210 [Verrucomicrobium sp.]